MATKKEVEFKDDLRAEPTVLKVNDLDPEKDLNIEEIEVLPDVEPTDQFNVTLKKRREATREKLAIVFVIGIFIIMIIATILGYISEENQIQNIIDLVLAFSGVLSGPLGFIIGYYFKGQEEEEL